MKWNLSFINYIMQLYVRASLLQSFMIKFLYNESDIIFLTVRSYQFYNFLEIYNFVYAHYKF